VEFEPGQFALALAGRAREADGRWRTI